MTEPTRDRWGRPLVIPPKGGDPVPYVRASKLAKSLDDLHNIMKWQNRLVLMGIGRRPDLPLRVSGVLAVHSDLDSLEAKRELNKIAESAMEAGGGSVKAETGTALHALTEAADMGKPLPPLSDEIRDRIEEYQVETSQLEVVDIETFVVNDAVKAAGTFDRLYRLPDGRVVVGDLKTGSSDPDYPLGVTIQTAIYAHGHRYDPETGERSELHPDLDPSVGILVHMPQGGKGTTLYQLDLKKGWRAAKVAAQVGDIRKWKKQDLREPLHLAMSEV